MIALVIEKGIPLPVQPEYRQRSGRPPKYDWSRMKIGDSTIVPTKSDARTAWTYGACNGKVFTSEKQIKPGTKRGWRVWRTG